MRVLQVMSTLNVGSGIASVVMNYYRNIDREKVQFDFLLFYAMPISFEEEARSLGARIFFVEKPSLKTMFKYKAKVDELFSANVGVWGAVHVHEVLVQAVVLPLAKKYGIKKRLLHAHGGMMRLSFKKYCRNTLLNIGVKKNATYYLGCSQEAGRAQFGDKIANGDRFSILNNGIDAKKFVYDEAMREEMRAELKVTNNFVIGHIGRFYEEKNQKFIVDVFADFLKVEPGARLILLGEGSTKPNIEDQITKLGIIDNVLILPQRKDIYNVLQVFDCFVFPSLHEGLGMALIEAQASGLDCLASTNVPIAAKVTDLVEYLSLDDKEAWVRNLKRVKTDQRTREDMSKSISNSGYDICAVANELIDIYYNK